MTKTQNLKIWAAQIRAPFLLLAVMLVLIGGGAAWRWVCFPWRHCSLS